MTMSAEVVLRKALAKIKDPVNWTKYASARDRYSNAVVVKDPDADCWCSTGAISAVASEDKEALAAHKILHDVTIRGLITFNDDPQTTHADVVAVFKKAIRRAAAARRKRNLARGITNKSR